MHDLHEEIALELSRLQRAALARLAKRNAEQQLGLAWVGLEMKTAERQEPLR